MPFFPGPTLDRWPYPSEHPAIADSAYVTFNISWFGRIGAASYPTDCPPNAEYQNPVYSRHGNNGSNVLFFDGHVDGVAQDDVLDMKFY